MLSEDLKEVKRYVDVQKKTFAMLPLPSSFQLGVVEGLNLVQQYLVMKDRRTEPAGTGPAAESAASGEVSSDGQGTGESQTR